MIKTTRKHLHRLLSGTALLMSAVTASAHVGYSGRDFGTIVPNAPAVTISNQSVTSNYGWADGTDEDFGDSHKVRPYRFTLAAPAFVTLTFSGSTNGGTKDGSIKPGVSVYQGLAHLAPITNAPGSADYDYSAISQAYLATLSGVAKEGAFRALTDWRMGGDNQTGPTFDFEAVDGLSTFTYKGHAVDGDSALYGAGAGIAGDGNADGTVTLSLALPAGDYTIFVGGADYAGQAPVPDAVSYGLVGTLSATAFNYVAGDPAAGGIGYQHQVTLDAQSAGSFKGHVGAWSWEDQGIAPAGGEGWTHTSNWTAITVQEATVLTVTMAKDAAVPYIGTGNVNGFAAVDHMFPSLTLWKNWDNDLMPENVATDLGYAPEDANDHHTYANRSNVVWAEDLEYVDHIENSTEETITRSWVLQPGQYTMALGSDSPSLSSPPRQGYKISFATAPTLIGDPAPGGIGYGYTVVADVGDSGTFSDHVGAWSWEDNALFGPGDEPVGWTHTSKWVAVRLQHEGFFTVTMARDANVPWPSVGDPSRLADTTSMFPSLTLWRNWDNDGGDHHTYNNHGNVAWAEDLRYVDHIDNATENTITRTWRLPAGEYSLALGSNAPATNPNRQGFSLSYNLAAADAVVAGDPSAGGVGYSHTINVAPGSSGGFSNHVGAWSWEDNALFGPGDDPVGWTHTSNWVAMHVQAPLTINVTMSRNSDVPWPSVENPDRKADITSMFPSLTLWRGWDNDGADSHTYNNHGPVAWAEDLSYIDHIDNSSAETITRSWTLPPGNYTFALGSNAPATNPNRQGYHFSWTTSAPQWTTPMITKQPASLALVEGKKAVFGVKAVGPDLSYEWKKDGATIAGETSSTLTIDGVGSADEGSYVCMVRNSAGAVASNPATLEVISKPDVDPLSFPDGVIGQMYQYTVTCPEPATSFRITGLPRGLRYNSRTGEVSGRPTVAGSFDVKVIALNKSGAGLPQEDTFVINAMPTGTTATFTGAIGRAPTLNDHLGGSIKVTTSTLGGFSGSILLGTSTYRLSGVLQSPLGSTTPTGSATILRRGQASLALAFTIRSDTGIMTGTLSDGTTTQPFTARPVVDDAAPFVANYTLAMSVDFMSAGDDGVPQGFSIGGFKVSTRGLASGVLKLADNTSLPFSCPLEKNGNMTLFRLLYRSTGSLLGVLNIDSASSFTLAASEVSWLKKAQAANSRDRVYKAGFGPLDLAVVGRPYAIPGTGALAMGLTANAAGNAMLTFEEGGAPDPSTNLDVAALEVKEGSPKAAGIVSANPGGVTLTLTPGKGTTFVPGVTGSLKGSFKLTDAAGNRTATFTGMIVDDGSGPVGYGFFLLPKLPEAGPPATTLRTSPILSGNLLLEPLP